MILTHTFLGAFFAFLSFGGLYFCARFLNRTLWPFCYLALLVAVCSLLSLQSLFFMSWLRPVVLVVLGSVSLLQAGRELRPYGVRNLLRWMHSQKTRAGQGAFQEPGTNLVLKILTGVVVATFALDFWYAAFPALRYDLTNYHLLVPQIVADTGPFRPPIFNDHIFFSGVYEYFFTLPRLFVLSDLTLLCYTTAFSWLSFVVPLYGLLKILAGQRRLQRREGVGNLERVQAEEEVGDAGKHSAKFSPCNFCRVLFNSIQNPASPPPSLCSPLFIMPRPSTKPLPMPNPMASF